MQTHNSRPIIPLSLKEYDGGEKLGFDVILNASPQSKKSNALPGNQPHTFTQSRIKCSTLLVTSVLVILSWTMCQKKGFYHWRNPPGSSLSIPKAISPVLDVFQVHAPVLDNKEASPPRECDVLLMEHSFAFSYGQPFVGMQPPPSL